MNEKYTRIFTYIYLFGVVTSGDRYRVPLICHEVERLLLSHPPTEPPRVRLYTPDSVSIFLPHPFYSRDAIVSLFLATATLMIFLLTLDE